MTSTFKAIRTFALVATLSGAFALNAQMTPPASSRHLYSETADPKADIAAGLRQARAEHKRLIVDFGGDWCGDCQVLDIYLHQAPNDQLMAKNFVIVHVSVGQIDKNLDIPTGYGINIKKGVPALAVLNGQGTVLYAQATGEFENMRNMSVQSVTDFLNKWKPQPATPAHKS